MAQNLVCSKELKISETFCNAATVTTEEKYKLEWRENEKHFDGHADDKICLFTFQNILKQFESDSASIKYIRQAYIFVN